MTERLICSICNKRIKDGEARYTGDERKGDFKHWDCYKPVLDEIEETTRKVLSGELDSIFSDKSVGTLLGEKPRRKKPVRPGEGPIAKKIAKLLAAALLDEFDCTVDPDDFHFWVQPPAYRGEKWDLAIWGADIQHPEYKALKIMCHSWVPMTKLAKKKKLGIFSDGHWSFDVS